MVADQAYATAPVGSLSTMVHRDRRVPAPGRGAVCATVPAATEPHGSPAAQGAPRTLVRRGFRKNLDCATRTDPPYPCAARPPARPAHDHCRVPARLAGGGDLPGRTHPSERRDPAPVVGPCHRPFYWVCLAGSLWSPTPCYGAGLGPAPGRRVLQNHSTFAEALALVRLSLWTGTSPFSRSRPPPDSQSPAAVPDPALGVPLLHQLSTTRIHPYDTPLQVVQSPGSHGPSFKAPCVNV